MRNRCSGVLASSGSLWSTHSFWVKTTTARPRVFNRTSIRISPLVASCWKRKRQRLSLDVHQARLEMVRSLWLCCWLEKSNCENLRKSMILSQLSPDQSWCCKRARAFSEARQLLCQVFLLAGDVFEDCQQQRNHRKLLRMKWINNCCQYYGMYDLVSEITSCPI